MVLSDRAGNSTTYWYYQKGEKRVDYSADQRVVTIQEKDAEEYIYEIWDYQNNQSKTVHTNIPPLKIDFSPRH